MDDQNTLWNTLTRPHESITDPIRRQRARVLAGLMLVFFILNVIGLLATVIGQGSLSSSAISGPITIGILYVASRTRRPEVGAGLAVMLLVIATTLILAANAMPNQVTLLLYALPVLFSVLVLNARVVAAVTVASVLAVIGLFLFDPQWMFDVQAFALPAGLVTGILILVVAIAFLREGDLTIIRSQREEVETYSQQLEQEVAVRSQNIVAVADIGRQMADTRDFERLIRLTVDLIVENFDFYHAQIFIVDEAGEWAVLRASTGAAGRQLLEREHRLEVGGQSVIGQVTERGEPVIALDTDTDATHRRNELLPNTRSELALPLRASGRIIGALDIQSTDANAFGQVDIPIFQTLADQLAVAIERIRLLDRTQEDIKQIEILNQQLTGEAWGRFVSGREDPLGYRAGRSGVTPIDLSDMPDGEPEDRINLPLKVRGETIGELEVTSRDGREPDSDTQYMLRAVAERVAQALDTTRLGEQSRRQAEQEQILSLLSAELQASGDLQTVLEVAVERASRAMGTSRGFIHLSMRLDETDE